MSSEWLFTKQALCNVPSVSRDKLTVVQERSYRRTTCAFIKEIGVKLKLPAVTIATAAVYLHRFYSRQSFRAFDRHILAAACVFLAGKAEETPRKLRDVITETFNARYKVDIENGKRPKFDPSLEQNRKTYWDMKERILSSESYLLQTICFDLDIKHPFSAVVQRIRHAQKNYNTPDDGGLQTITNEKWKDLKGVTIMFVNDSYRTTLCLQYPPEFIAVGSIYLASRFLRFPSPHKHKGVTGDTRKTLWWKMLGSERHAAALNDVCNQIRDLFDNQDLIGDGDHNFSGSSKPKLRLKPEVHPSQAGQHSSSSNHYHHHHHHHSSRPRSDASRSAGGHSQTHDRSAAAPSPAPSGGGGPASTASAPPATKPSSGDTVQVAPEVAAAIKASAAAASNSAPAGLSQAPRPVPVEVMPAPSADAAGRRADDAGTPGTAGSGSRHHHRHRRRSSSHGDDRRDSGGRSRRSSQDGHRHHHHHHHHHHRSRRHSRDGADEGPRPGSAGGSASSRSRRMSQERRPSCGEGAARELEMSAAAAPPSAPVTTTTASVDKPVGEGQDVTQGSGDGKGAESDVVAMETAVVKTVDVNNVQHSPKDSVPPPVPSAALDDPAATGRVKAAAGPDRYQPY